MSASSYRAGAELQQEWLFAVQEKELTIRSEKDKGEGTKDNDLD